MDSAAYVNGVKVGEWRYGYSSFTLEITKYLKQAFIENLSKNGIADEKNREIF